LGGHPKLIGMGEVASLLNPDLDYMDRADEFSCSCGSIVNQCVFWQPFIKHVQQDAITDFLDRYRWLIQSFISSFGTDFLLVDSSKRMQSLQNWLNIPGVELCVIHLIRDVRSWAISRNDVSKRAQDHSFKELFPKYGIKAIKKRYRRSAAYYFRWWYAENHRIHEFTKKK